MDQEQIIDLIKEIDIIKKEAVQDQRYYGQLTRCRKLQYKTQTIKTGSIHKANQEFEEQPTKRKAKRGE